MTKPVTPRYSLELASKLEELSGLASQITRCSNDLRTLFQSSPLATTTSACALLHVALSNAQGCLSLLQSISPAPVYSPPSPPSKQTVISPLWSSAPAPATTTLLSDTLLDLSFPSHPSAHATQMWPFPPVPFPTVNAAHEPSTYLSPGVFPIKECSPDPPLFNRSQTRHGVSIAELVDEEDSSPGTRGGVNPPRPVTTSPTMPVSQTHPPLVICIVDVTPRSTRTSEHPEVSRVGPLRSRSQSPPASPVRGYPRSITSEGGGTPRRPKRKGSLPTTPKFPERVTRSRLKRKATDDSETEPRPPKRTRIDSPQ